ncbi:MAG TPA: ABC transporter ATP-binding protein [Longimicrobiales bacterium]
MIELNNVTRIYPAAPGRGRHDTAALRDVSLAIPDGGVWGIVGPNGAGKTTLFGLVLGFLHPTEGTVRIDGLEPRRYLRRHGAAYLPERFRLPPEWTLGAALRALASLEGLQRRAARDRVDSLLDRFELTAHAAKPIGALSRGLNQRLGLAQALLADRPLVVLDEPTEGLDPLWRVRFRDVVAGLRDASRTLLIASHDLAEVERLADRVVLLEAGRVREVFDVARDAAGPLAYRLTLAAPSPAVAEAFPGAVEAIAGDGGRAGGGRSSPRTAAAVGPGPSTPGAAAAGAIAAPGAEADSPATGTTTYHVTVADATELSTRLAALLDAGAVVAAVTPAAEPLEDRVRRALDREAAR